MPPEGAKPRPRRARAPRAAPSSEAVDVRTSDGWSLRADVLEPKHAPVGVAVLSHAMMARRSSFERPRNGGLAAFFVERGWRTVLFDFRGHGDSGPSAKAGGSYRYDDLVAGDMPAIHAFARSRARRGRPVVLVGHSLGGHVGMANGRTRGRSRRIRRDRGGRRQRVAAIVRAVPSALGHQARPPGRHDGHNATDGAFPGASLARGE